MKKIVILPLLLMCLITIGCRNNTPKTDNQDNLIEWYNDVFTSVKEDTTSTIPNYIYNTDWMQQYIQYIVSNFEIRDDMLFGEIEGEPFDCRNWTIAYVNDDTIPEMLLYGGCWASGAVILTQNNGEVYTSPKGCFSYIKGSDGLIHSQWQHSDNVFGEVYKMKDGKITEIANYSCNTDFVDTSEVCNYGLTLDSLKNHYAGGEIGDSIVGVSEIELNGKRIGVCFGYNQYAYCTGFDMVKQTMDSLYYSKGKSTCFPHITRKMDINSLLLR